MATHVESSGAGSKAGPSPFRLAVVFASFAVILVLLWMSTGYDGGHRTITDWPLFGVACGLFALLGVWSLIRKMTGRGARLDQ